MWSQSYGKEIARILNLMVERPNPKYIDGDSTTEYFDGGEMRVWTGVTSFVFLDGTEAFYGSHFDLELTIKFLSGDEVSIKIPTRKCPRCDTSLAFGERFCRQCGQDCSGNRHK